MQGRFTRFSRTCGLPTVSVVKRFGSLIRVRPERLAEYKACHQAVWPEVLDLMRRCHMRNFSIYHKDGFLFSYYEYTGDDHAADMVRLAADPKNQEWWAYVMPMQAPLDTRQPGEWWASMEEVFHMD